MRAKFIIEIEADLFSEENDMKGDIMHQAEMVGWTIAEGGMKAPSQGRKPKVQSVKCQLTEPFEVSS